MDLDEKIGQARRHVASGRDVVERQRHLVEAGNAPPGAAELLEQFLKLQAIFESALARFIRERDELTSENFIVPRLPKGPPPSGR